MASHKSDGPRLVNGTRSPRPYFQYEERASVPAAGPPLPPICSGRGRSWRDTRKPGTPAPLRQSERRGHNPPDSQAGHAYRPSYRGRRGGAGHLRQHPAGSGIDPDHSLGCLCAHDGRPCAGAATRRATCAPYLTVFACQLGSSSALTKLQGYAPPRPRAQDSIYRP
jgi:hypothetical protein